MPETVAVNVTDWPTAGVVSLAATMTAGGCPGRIVTAVETVSEHPAASLAVAVTVYVPAA